MTESPQPMYREMFMKSKRARLGLLALMSVVALATCFRTTGPGAAQEAGQKSPAKKDAPDEAKIRALIAQLGDDSFDKREAAEKSLAAVGLPAFEQVRAPRRRLPTWKCANVLPVLSWN